MTDQNDDTLDYLSLPSSPPAFSPEEQAVLARINQKVAASESLEDVMNFLYDETRLLFPCDRIGLSFVEEEGKRVVANWTRAEYEPVLLGKGYAEDLHGSSLEHVLESGKPRLINDLAAYLTAHPNSRSTRVIVKEGVRSSMTCPLSVDGRRIGFLFRSSRKPDAYGTHEVQLHQAIAERLSQAVEKAYRIEELAAANRAYFEMLGFVSHELKSPLASIIMDCDVLTGGFLGALESQQQDRITRLSKKADYLLGLISDYLNLARLEGGKLEPNIRHGVDLVESVIEPAVEIVMPQIEERKIQFVKLVPKGLPAMACDPSLLKIVVVNLLGNAVKYGNEGGEVRLTVSQEDGVMRTVVWNEGPGFPKEEQKRLFRKFSRLNTPELMQRKGTGVGLYTCWRIIQLHNGKIKGASEHGQWAEFVFEVPVAGPSSAIRA